MKCIVYIDGFNLYYGALKDSDLKWLDICALCKNLLPSENVVKIRYFTAHVSGKIDPRAPARQISYLRALESTPIVDIHYGSFLTNPTRMPLLKPRPNGAKTVAVIKTEEKGSDVNLASYLLWDAFTSKCDTQVVVSNDSDFCETLRIARKEIGMRIGIVNPHYNGRASQSLTNNSDFTKRLTKSMLQSSQFPDPVIIQEGRKPVNKPTEWG